MLEIFVYGSLRKGQSAEHLLESSEFVKTTTTAAQYALYIFETYPALVPGQQPVHGEVYRVDKSVLTTLDEYEDAPKTYVRTKIELFDGSSILAYCLHPDHVANATKTEFTDWVQFN